MFNNVALDVAIGLVFIFLLYSMLATIIQEIIATKLAFRSKILQKAILRMLEDGKTTTSLPILDVFQGFYHLIFRSNFLKNKRFATAFYTHPLIKYLTEDNWSSKPEYLCSKNFSKVMIDLLHGIDANNLGINFLKIKESITSGYLEANLKTNDPQNPANKEYKDQNSASTAEYPEEKDINPETMLFLKSLLTESQGDIEKFKLLLEKWFDDTMERATSWYKSYTQSLLIIIGFILAVTFNVDSIAIYKILSKDKPAREQMVQLAIASKDKFKSEVDRQRVLTKGDTSSVSVNDSLLNETYKVIVEDANKSSKVMGLGKPWKDTCIICEDLETKKDYIKARMETLLRSKGATDVAKAKLRLLDSVEKTLQSSTVISKVETARLALLDTAAKRKFYANKTKVSLTNLAILDSLTKEKPLALNDINKFKLELREYDSLKTLSTRCAYIRKEVGDKWFKYSPNQAGGAETFTGWLITALAISLGAPFWFDLLNKLVKMRGSGDKKDSSNSSNPAVPNTPAPVTVNVNPNSGEEPVG